MRNYTSKAVLDNCRCPKPSAKQMKKWNRVLRQYTAEMDQLDEQLGFAELELELPPLKEWGYRSSLWDDMEMFGYEITDHSLESLKGFYKDPLTGNSRSEYHVPSEREMEVELLTVSVDSPPSYCVAWDAKPIVSNSVAIR